ncbi:hypothetical protein ACJJTC_002810 [Scirpophaga incertulas]
MENMDLFVINRYRHDSIDIDPTSQELKHFEKLKKDIEKRKNESFNHIMLHQKPNETLNNVCEENQINSIGEVKIDMRIEEVKKSGKEILNNSQKTIEEFKIIGGNDFAQKPKVQRILPFWLSHPYSISRDLQNVSFTVSEQDWLHNTLRSTLISQGISYLFPVQAQVIPFILREHYMPNCLWPRDICVSAPTGSGKTLSFVIPIIQVLMNETSHHIRAMVVLPVQELAAQIANVFKRYSVHTNVKIALLSGTTPLHQEQQQIVRYTDSFGWISKANIVVCTAGRLVEHLKNTKGFSLKKLKFLVIDEADRMMDNVQNDWLYHMDRHVKLENELMFGNVANVNWNSVYKQSAHPHKLLFSATLSQDPEKLEQWGLFQPKLFSAAPATNVDDDDHIRKYTTPKELKEEYISCNGEQKPLILYYLLMEMKWNKVLCFTNSSQTAHRLAVLLNAWGKGKIKAAELSAALDRVTRDSVLKNFMNSEINILIGTDALARGIDIPDCSYVISYDLPRNIKTYIHRVGRTGRAGRSGHALTILLQTQLQLFMDIIKSGGKSNMPQMTVKPETLSNISEDYQKAIEETKNIVHSEINSKVKKSVAVKRGFKSQKRKIE